jgi:NAD+ diphosphatase
MGENYDNKYIPAYIHLKPYEGSAWGIALINRKLLMKKNGNLFAVPEVRDLEGIFAADDSVEYIGRYEDHECYCKRLQEVPELPANIELVEMMQISELSGDPGLFLLAGTANHILHWNHGNQFCGCCGAKMTKKSDERAKVCPACNNITYPRISPAVITAVFREDKILLAHNQNFRAGMYSLIAGFVEPGEALEQCVEREIQEEVGIRVKNIRYFNSQPWPFPDSLMVAFTAEYDSGEITVDQLEITDAAWYQADSLPDIPSTDSVAGKMIRWFRDRA